MKRQFASGLVAAATFFGLHGPSVVQGAIYETGFENPPFVAGQSIDGVQGWVETAANITAQAQTATVFAGEQALGVTVSSVNGGSSFGFDAASQDAALSGSVTVGMRLRIGSVTSSQEARELFLTIAGSETLGGAAQSLLTISFQRNQDNLGAVDDRDIIIRGNGTTTVGKWTANTWMDLQIHLDTATDTFNVTINGVEQLAADAGFQSSRTATFITGASFNHSTFTAATYQVDDFFVVPEPASAALVLAGAALMTRRRS